MRLFYWCLFGWLVCVCVSQCVHCWRVCNNIILLLCVYLIIEIPIGDSISVCI